MFLTSVQKSLTEAGVPQRLNPNIGCTEDEEMSSSVALRLGIVGCGVISHMLRSCGKRNPGTNPDSQLL